MLVALTSFSVAERLAWPPWVAWAIVALWTAKDAILYPFLWRAYDRGDPAALPYPLQGAEGIALERIDPSGRVRIWGEVWRAELVRGIRRVEAGEAVQVTARHELTLQITKKAG